MVETARVVGSREHRESTRRRFKSRGRWHDLGEILRDLNTTYFDGTFDGQICWGRLVRRLRERRSIRLGSYVYEDHLIRVHPALDQAFVPRYYVEWVVYHEMLHQKVPCPTTNGRRMCHTREFRDIEACFPHHEIARSWEEDNLKRLLTF